MELSKSNRQTECKKCPTRCFIREYCPPELMDRINIRKNQVWYKKGQHVFYEGTIVFGVHFITQGKIKLVNSGPKEQIMRLASDGDVLGLGHLGKEDQLYTISAVALEDSLICFVKNEDFIDVSRKNSVMLLELLTYICRELRRTQVRIQILSQLGTRERVAETLHYLAYTFASDTTQGSLIDLSRQEIADLARTTPTQLSRELTSLKKEGILKTDGRKLIIPDPGKLSRIPTVNGE